MTVLQPTKRCHHLKHKCNYIFTPSTLHIHSTWNIYYRLEKNTKKSAQKDAYANSIAYILINEANASLDEALLHEIFMVCFKIYVLWNRKISVLAWWCMFTSATTSLAAIAMMSAQETTPGHTASTAALDLITVSKPSPSRVRLSGASCKINLSCR